MRSMDGAFILDKPAGITSFGAVRRVRNLLDGAKVGHMGTLDPLGTGVLPLLVGRATRFAQFFGGHRREYVAGIRFGWATSSYDADGDPLGEPAEVDLDEGRLREHLAGLAGPLLQVPPPVSAKKVGGVRAYKLARGSGPVNLEPVQVEIHEIELLGLDGPTARVRCLCSAGTYIRSLAHAVGGHFGCGAHVAELRRTLVGDFGLDGARTLEELEALRDEGRLEDALISAIDLLPDIPVERVDSASAARIVHGQDFTVSPFGDCREAKLVKAVSPEGRLLCVGRAIGPRMFHPELVFA